MTMKNVRDQEALIVKLATNKNKKRSKERAVESEIENKRNKSDKKKIKVVIDKIHHDAAYHPSKAKDFLRNDLCE